MKWRSPRGSLELDIDRARGGARGTLTIPDPDWRQLALDAFHAVCRLGSPLLPACPGAIDYVIGHEIAPVTANAARQAGWQLADAIAVCHGGEILVGPLLRELIWHPVATGVSTIIGAGLTRVVLAYEAGLRGAAMTTRHFRSSPEQIAGRAATPHTDVFYLAHFGCELATGREPFPTASALDYMRAVTDGRADVPADLPREVAAALTPDPTARPSLRTLRDALISSHA
jgi:hypothetical protein